MIQRYGVETEIDKSIDILATSIVECNMKVYTGECVESECSTCEKRAMQEHTYAMLSDIDRLAVDNAMYRKARVAGAIYNNSRAHKYSIKENIKYAFSVALIPIIIIVGLILFMCMLSSAAYPVKSLDSYHRYRFPGENYALEAYRKNIYDCLLDTDRLITDVNNDNEINCQDWALTFYSVWNASGFLPNTCALVLNVNEHTGMNHMFIAVRYCDIVNSWEYIEPQAFKDGECSRSYFMEDYWGKMYNPLFNNICTEYLYNKYFIQKRRGEFNVKKE